MYWAQDVLPTQAVELRAAGLCTAPVTIHIPSVEFFAAFKMTGEGVSVIRFSAKFQQLDLEYSRCTRDS
jgi:hypothetical protein